MFTCAWVCSRICTCIDGRGQCGLSLSITFYIIFWRQGVSLTLELTWFFYVGSRDLNSSPHACKARTFLIAPSPQLHPSLALLRCSWLSPTSQLTLQMN